MTSDQPTRQRMPVRHRALFLSDFHLGMRGNQAVRLVEFLSHNDADTIYLVGDVVDGWRLRNGWYWPESHNQVVQSLLRKARKGARVIYLPGNHDDFMRDYPGRHFGGVEVMDSVIHVTATGRRYLVIHGDQFDVVVRRMPWLSVIGDAAYRSAIIANAGVNRIRAGLKMPYWSLSAWAKNRVKNIVNFFGDYRSTLVEAARRNNAEGVVCGHIHHADMHDQFGIHYVNTGDWVESCTAVAEDFEGKLDLIRWGGSVEPAFQPVLDLEEEAAVSSGGAALMDLLTSVLPADGKPTGPARG